jgi:Arc/MetJ family transcription regulator
MLVYMSRTNIDIDDEVITRVQKIYGLRTKKDAVDFALRRLLVEPMSEAEAKAMRGSGWAGDLEEMRTHLGPRE